MKAIVCALFLFSSSLSFAQKNEGTHRVQRKKNTANNGSVISGSVVDFTTNQPLKVAFVKIDSVWIQADTSGHFQTTVLPGKHQIRAGFIGYYLIIVDTFKVKKGELVNILFRVKEDERPTTN